jgi:hypothetical protein
MGGAPPVSALLTNIGLGERGMRKIEFYKILLQIVVQAIFNLTKKTVVCLRKNHGT